MQDFILTNLVNAELLQELQEVFAMKNNIASGISDAQGVSVTTISLGTEFCEKWTKGTAKGLEACEDCARRGAHMSMDIGRASVYQCHAGLFDIAAPIIVEGQLCGCFVGGQVMASPPSQKHIYRIAKELGIEPEAYWEAAQKVPVLGSVELREAVNHIYSSAMIISDIATNKYQVVKANNEIETAYKMKSDFLANTSHEIRTPMNAVIGMADMALREDLPPAAREYILQIKHSGRMLLAIINDILDFSKIESGKMDISMGEYSPIEIIHDVANIIAAQIGDKKVELTLDVPPELTKELMGDANRIKQVLTNIANNAVKFTQEGQVAIKVEMNKIGEREQELHISVMDTGIGIKKEDLNRIFESFQQVDSKRNRNIEGTGLGLVISKRLIELMGGTLDVKSVYGVGSKFSFRVPQLQLRETQPLFIKDTDSATVAALLANVYSREQLEIDVKRLGGHYRNLTSVKEIYRLREEGVNYLFLDYANYSDEIHTYAKENPEMTVVLMTRFQRNFKSDLENLVVLRKPVYTYSLVGLFNHEDIHAMRSEEENVSIDYIAPTAKALVVDDSEVNLAVAVGLLKPLQMRVDTVTSGKDAIEKISEIHYDIVFMDHMMPEMDGVETTRIIRRLHPEYNNVPIIALTANVMEETKAMFLVEGMNDFLAKPVEVKLMMDMVRRWLPPEKIQEAKGLSLSSTRMSIAIPGLDLDAALKMVGSEAVLWEVLRNYYRVIPKKRQKIKDTYEGEDWPAYTIEVHALKSASRQIGATELADCAAGLEKAGNERNLEMIHQHTSELLRLYASVEALLRPYCESDEEEEEGQQELSKEVLYQIFDDMLAAMEELDMDGMYAVIDKMKEFRYEGEQKELFAQLREAVEDLDVDLCEKIIEKWKML